MNQLFHTPLSYLTQITLQYTYIDELVNWTVQLFHKSHCGSNLYLYWKVGWDIKKKTIHKLSNKGNLWILSFCSQTVNEWSRDLISDNSFSIYPGKATLNIIQSLLLKPKFIASSTSHDVDVSWKMMSFLYGKG